MIINSHELTIQFFDAQGGDAIWIRYLGNDARWHNILIDGGYIGSYDEIFKPVIDSISTAGELIDLWIVTHIDLDHIGAIVSFIRDSSIQDKDKLLGSCWFNHAGYTIPDDSSKIGYRQGIRLRDFLEGIGKLGNEKITDETGTAEFYGLQLKLLSPNAEKIAAADRDWVEREKKTSIRMARSDSDHHKRIEDFDLKTFNEDTDIVNGSSITFILKFKGVSGLFLADGHPSDVVGSLKRLNYTLQCPLLLSFVKVSHHGSKYNTSQELLELIRTGIYVISANGISNKHPDKETLARILKFHLSIGQTIIFLFAANTSHIRSLFLVDKDPQKRYNFNQVFIEEGAVQTSLNFLPINL